MINTKDNEKDLELLECNTSRITWTRRLIWVTCLHQDFAHEALTREVGVRLVEGISGAVATGSEEAALAVSRELLSKSRKWDS